MAIEVVDPVAAPAVAAVTAYFDELDARFPDGFDPDDALAEDAPTFRAPGGAFVLATVDGEPTGCGGIQTLEPGLGEIKRMWVAEAVRGVGLGRRLLGRLEDEGRALGHHRVRLDTNTVLTTAIALYESAGYHPIERYNDNPYAGAWFEKEL